MMLRWAALLSELALDRARGDGVSVAREPCSERKFQSHPTVPPGRLIELAFAAVYRE